VASGGDEETVVWAEVQLKKVHQVRSEFPALKDIVFRFPYRGACSARPLTEVGDEDYKNIHEV